MLLTTLLYLKKKDNGINNAAVDGPWLTVVQLNEFLT